ncbi:MAG: FecR domain-containing protein [Flavobacteriia bacterium]|nr:FecR domain-containing protein [Flavobacteriia bacterium]
MNNKNLISKVISGNASSSEMNKFQSWLSENDENKLDYQQQLTIWQMTSNENQIDDLEPDVESAWASFLEKKEQSFDSSSKIIYKIAAVLIVVLTVGSISSYVLFKNNQQESNFFAKNWFPKVKTEKKEAKENNSTLNIQTAENSAKLSLKRKVRRKNSNKNYVEYVLIDSSNIKLTDNSALKFLEQDKQNSRIASLMGAGIFDIKPSNQLFILETEHVIIHVEGTKFRVNDPSDDFPFVELYVNEGSMEVFEKNNISNSISLNSGQKYLFDIKNRQFIEIKEKAKKQNKWKLFWKNNKNK